MKTTSCRLFFGHMFVASAEDSNVGIIGFAFTPAALTAKLGTTVTFGNHDGTVIVGVGPYFAPRRWTPEIGLASDWIDLAILLIFAACTRIGNAIRREASVTVA
jgi:hypothetical protein